MKEAHSNRDEKTGAASPSRQPSSSLKPVSVEVPDRNGQFDNGKYNDTSNHHRYGWLQRFLYIGKKGTAQIREDLTDALSTTEHADNGFTPEEKAMLNNVLRLQHVRIEDVMTPRAELQAIDIDTTLGELLCAFEETGHSRLPVYHESLDDPRGMVHIRDVVTYITRAARLSEKEASIRKRSLPANLDMKKAPLSKPLSELNLLRDVLFVPPSMLVSDLMEKMQATRLQMALVIDEYGGTDGLVSLEDLVEIIVGNIEDEHDEENVNLIVEISPGVFVCDARAEIGDIMTKVGDTLQIGDVGEDIDTIGGLVFTVIGRVPAKGEIIEAFGFEFRVIDADPRRIKKIQLTPFVKHEEIQK